LIYARLGRRILDEFIGGISMGDSHFCIFTK